jgi:hypothetical protein
MSKKLATNEENQLIAIGVAEIVLVIYERKYPNNDVPRKAIQAAKDYLNGSMSLDELRTAAADAADAADAAYDAAYAAAYAYDAAYAAYATADAAYATADAAYAAYAHPKYMDLLLSFLIDFCNK